MMEKSYEPQVDLTAFEAAPKQRWLLRRLLTLALLTVFVLILVKYGSWFRDILTDGSVDIPVSTPDTIAEKSRHDGSIKSRRTSGKHHADAAVPPGSEAQLTLTPGMTASVVRKPLAVEVISDGGQHRIVRTHNKSVYLDLRHQAPAAPPVSDADAGPATSKIQAVQQTHLSPSGAELASSPVEAIHPLLAKRKMETEGSVVLLARIGKDGGVQSLQMLSGPEDLFAAAREAVQPWRFKPYFKSGKAVETDIQITVNFAISAQ
jgi:TonB family protein